MKTSSSRRWILKVVGLCFMAAQALCLPARAQETIGGEKLYNDYFAKDRDNGLLAMVEKYHLNPETSTFWKLFRGKEYGYAIKDMEFILRYYSNHPKALSLLCSLSGLLKQNAHPIGFFQKAISQYPQHALTHAQFGSYLATINQIQPGIDQLREAIKLDPKLAIAHAWLAEALLKDGKRDLAKESLKTARQLGFTGSVEGMDSEPAPQPAGGDAKKH